MDPIVMEAAVLAQISGATSARVMLGFASVVAFVLLAMVVARWVIWPTFKGIGWVIGGLFAFLGREVRDLLRLTGALVTTVVYVPLILGTLLIGRWSASGHFGRSLRNEVGIAGKCVYRLVAANLLTSFGMRDVVAGIEERVPQALADAPGTDAPRPKSGQFDGYTIVGSLPGGGSGGKLYIAEPDAIKAAGFERNGHFGVGQVVVKVFSLRDGSSLPQIVRESRALDAARKLGLVLDHELTPERFFYVMRYVPGQSLTAVTHQLHAASSPADGSRGLDDASLRRALSFMRDLVATLDAYHRGGLWHKDVKPDNIIVDGDRAQLVDFGLVTPLRSAMTLTTHGTEYFRDPEMVKMAHKGVKVHEVDGARFDVYGAGAVLYSIIENSFPAHGMLSQIKMRCPEALRWVVRRAMAEYDKRYATAGAMLRDLEAIRLAADPMAVKPGQLPSMADGDEVEMTEAEAMPDFTPARVRQAGSPAGRAAGVGAGVGAGAGVPPPLPWAAPAGVGGAVPPPLPGAGVGMGAGVRPEVRITNWMTGEFEVANAGAASAVGAGAFAGVGRAARREAGAARRSAREQVESARGRAAAARERVRTRMASRMAGGRPYSNNPNSGTYIAAAVVLAAVLFVFGGVFTLRSEVRPEPSLSPEIEYSGSTVGGPRVQAPVRNAAESPRVGRTKPATSPVVTGEGATVLVVVDLKKPLSGAHAAEIRAAVERLENAGFEVLGDYPGAEPDEDELEATAGVIKAAEGYAVDTQPGGEAVGAWLGEHGGTELVLWFKPVAGSRADGGDVTLKRVVIGARVGDEERAAEVRAAVGTAEKVLR